MLRCGHSSDHGLSMDLTERKEFGLWGPHRPGLELLFCHFSVVCSGNILKPLSLCFLVCKMELMPTPRLLKGSNATGIGKHKLLIEEEQDGGQNRDQYNENYSPTAGH